VSEKLSDGRKLDAQRCYSLSVDRLRRGLCLACSSRSVIRLIDRGLLGRDVSALGGTTHYHFERLVPQMRVSAKVARAGRASGAL